MTKQEAFIQYSNYIVTNNMNLSKRDFYSGWDAAVKNLNISDVINQVCEKCKAVNLDSKTEEILKYNFNK